VLSEGEGSEGFTDDLAQLANLTGRPQQKVESQRVKRKKAERRERLVEEFNRDQNQSRLQFPFDSPEPRKASGSMDELERQIRQMTIKKPDPYVSTISYQSRD
jgi:hypothetical protein